TAENGRSSRECTKCRSRRDRIQGKCATCRSWRNRYRSTPDTYASGGTRSPNVSSPSAITETWRMCGRFTLRISSAELAEWFGVAGVPALAPRYNIAPTQTVPMIRTAKDGTGRELVVARWGLVPHWAKDVSIGNRMINARADTVAEKPAFRTAFRRR